MEMDLNVFWELIDQAMVQPDPAQCGFCVYVNLIRRFSSISVNSFPGADVALWCQPPSTAQNK